VFAAKLKFPIKSTFCQVLSPLGENQHQLLSSAFIPDGSPLESVCIETSILPAGEPTVVLKYTDALATLPIVDS
jgi:hypothetical protein